MSHSCWRLDLRVATSQFHEGAICGLCLALPWQSRQLQAKSWMWNYAMRSQAKSRIPANLSVDDCLARTEEVQHRNDWFSNLDWYTNIHIYSSMCYVVNASVISMPRSLEVLGKGTHFLLQLSSTADWGILALQACGRSWSVPIGRLGAGRTNGTASPSRISGSWRKRHSWCWLRRWPSSVVKMIPSSTESKMLLVRRTLKLTQFHPWTQKMSLVTVKQPLGDRSPSSGPPLPSPPGLQREEVRCLSELCWGWALGNYGWLKPLGQCLFFLWALSALIRNFCWYFRLSLLRWPPVGLEMFVIIP